MISPLWQNLEMNVEDRLITEGSCGATPSVVTLPPFHRIYKCGVASCRSRGRFSALHIQINKSLMLNSDISQKNALVAPNTSSFYTDRSLATLRKL